MKRILTFTVLFAVLFSFAGCAAVTENFIDEFKEGYEAGKEYVEDQLGNATDPETADISRGSVSEDTYTSEYSGLTFTCPEGWKLYSDEEIAEVMGVTEESLNADSFADSAADMLSVYDMMAVDTVTGSNVIVMYENLGMTDSENITEEQYMASVEKQLMAQTEVIYKKADDGRRVLLGECEYLRVAYTVENSGMAQVYYVRKIDGYINGIVVTLVGDCPADAVEAMFS